MYIDKGAGVSDNMTGLVLFLLVPIVFSFDTEYKAFDSCGEGGWTCSGLPGDFVVTYNCNVLDRTARVWVWTARVPRYTTSIGVANCDHVEVHIDCTTGFRSYTLQSFFATNVKHLEFLKPLKPFVFLHDNDEIPNAPPEIRLKDIEKLTVYPGIFDKASGRCRNKMRSLETMKFENVNVGMIPGYLFNHTLKSFSIINSTILSIARRSITVHGNSYFQNSRLGVISNNGIVLLGSEAVFKSNVFESILNNGINLRVEKFQFSNNVVMGIADEAFDSVSFNSTVSFNRFQTISTGAFSKISPGFITSDHDTGEKSSYSFIGNQIEEMEVNSISPNYGAYERVCSVVTVRDNELPCTCGSLNWAPRNQHFHTRGFYEMLTESSSNKCRGIPDCTLQMMFTLFPKEECSPETNIHEICNSSLVTVTDITEPAIDMTMTMPISYNSPMPTLSDEESNANVTYFEQHTASESSVVVIVLPTVLIIAVAGAAFGYWFFYKKNKNDFSVTSQWRSGFEEETLIDERQFENCRLPETST